MEIPQTPSLLPVNNVYILLTLFQSKSKRSL